MSVPRVDDFSSEQFERSVTAAHDGSFAALGQLLDHYREYLLRIANQEMNGELAGKIAPSDLVQETFLQATQAFRQFEGRTEAELRAWLRKILVNNILETQKCFRTQKRAVSLEVPLESDGSAAPIELPCPAPRPSSLAVSAERRVAVERALARLPEDYRRVLTLRSFEDRPFEEVGRELDRSAEAARRLWSRAIQRLAMELTE